MAQSMQIGMVMLGVADLERSVAFYEKNVGFAVKGTTPGLAFLDTGPVMLILSEPLAKATGAKGGAAEYVIPVDSVREAFDELRSRGVEFTQEPRTVTSDRWAANFKDPDGHLWSVFGPE